MKLPLVRLAAGATVGATITFAAVCLTQYASVFLPPGRLLGAERLAVIARRPPAPGGQFRPMAVRAFDSVTEALGGSLAMGSAVTKSGDHRIQDQVFTASTTLVNGAFWSLTSPTIQAGRSFSGTGRHDSSARVECLVVQSVELRLGQAGGIIETPLGNCQPIGVLSQRWVTYWLPSTSVLLLQDADSPSRDHRLASSLDIDSMFLLIERPRDLALDALSLRVATMVRGEQAGLVAVKVEEFLFPAGLRGAARASGYAAALAGVFGVLCLFMVTALEVAVRIQDLQLHARLGATRRSFLRRELASIVRRGVRDPLLAGLGIAAAGLSFSVARPTHVWTIAITIAIAGTAAVLIGPMLRTLALGRAARNVRPLKSPAFVIVVVMVALQAAASATLMCASTYGSAFRHLAAVDLGFQPGSLYATEVMRGRAFSLDDSSAVLPTVLARAAALPGVQVASASVGSPVAALEDTVSLALEERDQFIGPNVARRLGLRLPDRHIVAPGYAQALGISVRGRDIEVTDDRANKRIALVNETMARTYWAGVEVIGRRFRLRPRSDKTEEWIEVVGVVADVRHEGPRGTIKPEFYLSGLKENVSFSAWTLLLRAVDGTTLKARDVEHAVREASADLTVRRFYNVLGEVNESLGNLERVATSVSILSYVSCVTLFVVLALAGLIFVSSERRALSIRYALGASRRLLIQPLITRATVGLGVGAAIGIPVGVIIINAARHVESDLADVSVAGYLASSVSVVIGVSIATAAAWRAWSVRDVVQNLRTGGQ